MDKPNSIFADFRFQGNLNVGSNGVVSTVSHDGTRNDPTLFEFRETESDAENKQRVIDYTENELAQLEAKIAEFRTNRDKFLDDSIAYFRYVEDETENTTEE